MPIFDLTVEQCINLVLTAIIMLAVIAQACFTRTQARLLRESQRWAREREKPAVRITSLSHTMSRGSADGFTTTSFEGFTVTNAGFVDIEITLFAFELGRMLNSGENDSPTAEITFQPVMQHGQTTLSTMSLPHRLRPSESFKILYDSTQLVEESTSIGGETPVHMRPYCLDSLGNKHTPNHWIVYRDNHITFVDGPSPGRISEEDWKKLKPREQQRYSHWSKRGVTSW